jgi:hypothetical protein
LHTFGAVAKYLDYDIVGSATYNISNIDNTDDDNNNNNHNTIRQSPLFSGGNPYKHCRKNRKL